MTIIQSLSFLCDGGKVPGNLRITLVKLLYKKGSKNEYCNYCSIALIFEEIKLLNMMPLIDQKIL